MNVLSQQNHKKLSELNTLLLEKKLTHVFTAENIDDGQFIGVKIGLPSIINSNKEPMYLEIKDSKQYFKTVDQTLIDINHDVKELLTELEVEIVRSLKQMEAKKFIEKEMKEMEEKINKQVTPDSNKLKNNTDNDDFKIYITFLR